MQYQFSMNESVESVTRKLVALCKTQKAPESRAQMFRLFQLLCSMKFDFYLILSILCNLNEFSTSELKIICKPLPRQIKFFNRHRRIFVLLFLVGRLQSIILAALQILLQMFTKK